MSNELDAYTTVFGKEHPGRLRSVGQCVCPSRIFASSSSSGGGSSRVDRTELSAKYESLQQEFDEMKSQMALIMQHMGGSLPTEFFNTDQVSIIFFQLKCLCYFNT